MFLDDLYHMLDPVAFTLGPLTVRWYGIAYLLGFICAGIVMWRTQKRWRLGLSVDDVFSIVIGVVFGIIIGARLFYVVFYGAGYYLEHPLEIVMLNHGGMSFHGGLVGAVVGLAVPLLLRYFGRDPAMGGSVLLTFTTDSGGFLIFLGLATFFFRNVPAA